MKPELDDKLCADFPLLYRRRRLPMTETSMCWGFQCGDGWHGIIRRLSEKLEKAISEFPAYGKRPAASGVKEKYGTLRFDMSPSTSEMELWIELAEAESADTCERCGEPGELRDSGYMVTLCNKCNTPDAV